MHPTLRTFVTNRRSPPPANHRGFRLEKGDHRLLHADPICVRWRKLRTTNVIERCFVEVRRRTPPMVVFTNVASVNRIIYAIFSRFNQDWKTYAFNLFTPAA